MAIESKDPSARRQRAIRRAVHIAGLIRVIAEVRVGRRPGRLEPRAIKQRPKAFPRLQTTRRRARAIIRQHDRPRRLAAQLSAIQS